MRVFLAAIVIATTSIFVQPALANGDYRWGEVVIKVEVKNDKLYCTIKSSGFKICYALDQVNNAKYKGDGFKFPDKPKTAYTGQITFTGNKARVQACSADPGDCHNDYWYRLGN